MNWFINLNLSYNQSPKNATIRNLSLKEGEKLWITLINKAETNIIVDNPVDMWITRMFVRNLKWGFIKKKRNKRGRKSLLNQSSKSKLVLSQLKMRKKLI